MRRGVVGAVDDDACVADGGDYGVDFWRGTGRDFGEDEADGWVFVADAGGERGEAEVVGDGEEFEFVVGVVVWVLFAALFECCCGEKVVVVVKGGDSRDQLVIHLFFFFFFFVALFGRGRRIFPVRFRFLKEQSCFGDGGYFYPFLAILRDYINQRTSLFRLLGFVQDLGGWALPVEALEEGD